MKPISEQRGQDNVSKPVVAKPLPGSARSLFLGILFGAFFLTLAFRRTSWSLVLETLKSANIVFLFYGIGIYAIYLLARAWRWNFLLAEQTKHRPFFSLFRAVTWGTAANAVIPHSGEVLRAFSTRRPLNLSATSILGTIAAERLYDFAAVILLTSLTLFLMADAPQILTDALVAILIMGGIVLLPLTALAFKNPLMLGLLNVISRILPKRFGDKVLWMIKELSSGIRSAFSNSYLSVIAFLSMLQWLCVSVCIYFSLIALSLKLPFWVALIILPITIAGLTLPSAPAYLGTMQVCFLAGLTPFGISDETAIAASLVYLNIVTVPVMLISGVWYVLHLAKFKRSF